MVYVVMNSAGLVINSFSKYSLPKGSSQTGSGFFTMVTLEPSLVWNLEDAQGSSVE